MPAWHKKRRKVSRMVRALDFVLKARDHRADVGERVADVLHVPYRSCDAMRSRTNSCTGIPFPSPPRGEGSCIRPLTMTPPTGMPKSLEKR